MKETRTRNWATIIYPRQSEEDVTECPENWAEVLEGMGVKCAVSPLHDKDVKENGEYKKPHRHVLFAFDGVKSRAQVAELCKQIGGAGCEAINSLYAQVRYLTHMDSPDKAQYSTLDVLTFGGFEYKRYANTKEDEERETNSKVCRIMTLAVEHELHYFGELADYIVGEEPELFGVMRRNSYFFAQYLKSKQDFTKPLREKELYLEQNGRAGLHNLQSPPEN